MWKSLSISGVSVLALGLVSGEALAQATLDRVLATVSVSGSSACSTVDVRFNRAASYRHHAPKGGGREVDISMELLGTDAGIDQQPAEREAASVPPGNAAGLDAVVLLPQPAREAVLQVSFERPVRYRVVMDSNTRHLRIDVAAPDAAASCLGQGADAADPESNVAAKGDAAPAAGDAASALKEGKKALAARDYARATAHLTKAANTGKGTIRQEAQEMLGLSHERAGQLAHAKAEYQAYLHDYPSGAGHDRVRARLDGVLAAMDQTAQTQMQKLRMRPAPEAADQIKADGPQDLTDGTGRGQASPQDIRLDGSGVRVTDKGVVMNHTAAETKPGGWTWEKNGSLAQYYYRNDSLRSSDPTKQNYGLHEVYQNEILSSADTYLRGESQDYEVELRASLYNERGFGTQSDINTTSVGALYAEGVMKNAGLSAKLGRQSKSTGGVFGRFDGGLLGWDLGNDVKLQAYGGSPVYRRDAKPFADDRYFYGASIDYTVPGDHWAGGLYTIGQNVESITDRRALGAEVRYTDEQLSAYSAVDYDIFYKELNNAYFNANWRVRDGTNLYGTVDFRRVPFLVTSNALMGQTEDDLQSLVDIFGEDEVYQLAVDRTATAKTASLGLSQEISKTWQVTVDGMVADYSGTPASGGVDAIPDPGIEFYGSLQLMGTDVFNDRDALNLGLRFSRSDSSNFYMGDAYYRFMLTDDWRVSPRLRLSFRDSRTSDQKQYVVSSSLASRYKFNRHWSFETEFGVRWEDIVTGGNDARTIDLLATAGYRYEF